MEALLSSKDRARLSAHDDYLAATREMSKRQREMSVRAQRGDEFARGWIAAMAEFSLAVQAQLARRIGA